MSDTPQDKTERITRVYKAETEDVSEAKRTVVHTITTDCLDRYQEIIVAKGIQLDNFRANPVVLWCHNPYVPPIGKNLWTKKYTKDGKSGLIAKTLFAKSEMAQEVFELYRDGFLNGWSIGANLVRGTNYGPPTDEEVKAQPHWKLARQVYRKVDLTEYSACSIPANPEALGQEVGKSISLAIRKAIEDGPRWEPAAAPTPPAKSADTPTDPVETPTPPVVKDVELPRLTGARTFQMALAATKAAALSMTTRSAGERAAQDAIDRLKGRV